MGKERAVSGSEHRPRTPTKKKRALTRASERLNLVAQAAVAKAKALQDQQQGPAWNNKRMCAALVCVAVWTYAIIYFATLYSYRLEALRLRRVIRGA